MASAVATPRCRAPGPAGGSRRGPLRAAAGRRALDYWWERRGRNLIQARTPMATSTNGENRKCTAKLSAARATMTIRARAMIAGMVIGLRSRQPDCGQEVAVVVFTLQGCRRW